MLTKPDWHPEDVKAAIRKTGLSCAALSVQFGLHKSSVSAALRQSWPSLEGLIAGHLNLAPSAIWPSRYDEQGKPLPYKPNGRPRRKLVGNPTTITHRNHGSTT